MKKENMIYPYLFINGEILHKDQALIPVYDLGLLRGLGIFDFFRVWDGVPVFAEDHIMRLQHSLELIGLNTGVSKDQWMKWFHEMIQINKAERAGFRVVVTGGFSEDGYTIPEQKNIYLMLHHLPENDPQQYVKGVSLLTSSYQRDIPSAKTTIYIQSMQLQPQIKKAGAFEVLYHWKGEITECSRCNIFFIDNNGAIHTPKNSMLKGITRKQVISIANEAGIQIIERDIQLEELPSMAGAFLTATTKGVLPVVKIDDLTIGDGNVHPVAKKLESLYQERVNSYLANALQNQNA
ncbi:MAG TPA: aminotransferase class IV [Saprospiraceae bacterium]|nr:aminotransferase class IV [Saprospiraceae bacterium]